MTMDAAIYSAGPFKCRFPNCHDPVKHWHSEDVLYNLIHTLQIEVDTERVLRLAAERRVRELDPPTKTLAMTEEELELLRQNRFVEAVKAYRFRVGVGLKVAYDFVRSHRKPGGGLLE